MTKKNIKTLLILVSTALLAWVLPWLIKLSTNEACRYPFTYYSSVKNEFFQVVKEDAETVLMDQSSHEYTRAEYDSLLPMLSYRQLLKDGRLPDSLNGKAISGKSIQLEQFYFKYSPRDKHHKQMDLNPMFESMSGRVQIESPDDLFSIKNKMVFIDAETNSVLENKSSQFHQAMIKRGYKFPTKMVAGNPSTKKLYDEGWFALDANNQLYHIKMVNGQPFVKDTKAGEKLDIDFVKTIETQNRRMYAFVFDRSGKLYYLSDVSYEPVQLPIDAYNTNTDGLSIMANPFYWNVVVTTPAQRITYALDNHTLEEVDRLTETRESTTWEKIHPYVFPFYIEMKSMYSKFVYPRLLGWSVKALVLNAVLAVLLAFLSYRRKQSIKPLQLLLVLCTGLYGLIALWLFNEKQQETRNVIQLK
ncbi:DUF4857 domain-containing protein [Carboxylicivirga sediminis]|uniref:DUF4857 domain-containing protein n=1 Tax=Carboxylicivirga sediminis TaxID=2006564 RepID=A0A941F1K3_9BACT|nr:DUF4857 domain-containing protein [Carboxylicivirga sediminis]MBR8534319.1 DUF4857 domain-containing protein [Carboxylicivirga sediminis]